MWSTINCPPSPLRKVTSTEKTALEGAMILDYITRAFLMVTRIKQRLMGADMRCSTVTV